jgi:cysteine dioxygenase
VFRPLIEEFRRRGPLDRREGDVGALLVQSAGSWPRRGRLVSRPGDFTRTCAYRDDRFEVALLNWAPGAVSPIHDHGDQHCWMLVLEGSLEVDDYIRLDAGDVPGRANVRATGSRQLRKGSLDLRSGRFDLHRVAASQGPAISLHVYAGPLHEYLVYDEPSQRCSKARGIYDAVLSVYSEPLVS